MNVVIFEIDNDHDTHAVAKFLRHIDTKQAQGLMKGKLIHCIGCWLDTMATSYLMREDDFLEYVMPGGYVDNQDAFLVVTDHHKRPMVASLQLKGKAWGSERVGLGQLKAVDYSETLMHDGWTYRKDLDTYWVAS